MGWCLFANGYHSKDSCATLLDLKFRKRACVDSGTGAQRPVWRPGGPQQAAAMDTFGASHLGQACYYAVAVSE
jgi:hypothetical protein